MHPYFSTYSFLSSTILEVLSQEEVVDEEIIFTMSLYLKVSLLKCAPPGISKGLLLDRVSKMYIADNHRKIAIAEENDKVLEVLFESNKLWLLDLAIEPMNTENEEATWLSAWETECLGRIKESIDPEPYYEILKVIDEQMSKRLDHSLMELYLIKKAFSKCEML